MNVYLKSAVQNLDCVIAQLTEWRNGLAAYLPGAGPEIGTEVFAPASAEAPARQAVPVQTLERRPKKLTQRRKGAEKRKENQKGGGAARGKFQISSSKAWEPVVLAAGTGERAKTLGGAMKLIAGAMGTFTREAVREALDKDYGEEEFVKNAGASTFAGNIGYWLKSGKLQENEAGVLKVVDREFFGHVEFK